MNLVRGRGVWLYDENALSYLDSLNNVTHVGHAEPRVTASAARQMQKLNTNSRFLYEGIASYAERLISTLPSPLEVVFLVCSGSEANDLAVRIARQVTGRQDIAIIDGAYHGNTGVVTGLSPNRYKGPGGAGAPHTTHEVPTPDRFRGAYGYDDPTRERSTRPMPSTCLKPLVPPVHRPRPSSLNPLWVRRATLSCRRTIWRTASPRRDRSAHCASPMKCKWAWAAWETPFGASSWRRRARHRDDG